MRICDVCNDPDPFKRKLAVGRITFERTDPEAQVPKFKAYDVCKSCLVMPLTAVLEKKES